MARIQLANSDAVAVVDDDLFPKLSRWTWRAMKSRSGIYPRASIDGTRVLMHRYIAAMQGWDHAMTIDHINHDTLDNRVANLRPATYAENAHNKAAPTGVRRSRDAWIVVFVRGGKTHYFGRYQNREEADAVAEAARLAIDAPLHTPTLEKLDGLIDTLTRIRAALADARRRAA